MARANELTLDEWRALYDLTIRIKELTPWKWMEESHLFGFQDPETGEFNFVSVMGMAGEHIAVGVYKGLDGYWGIMELGAELAMVDMLGTTPDDMPPINPMRLINIPQVQLAFGSRRDLDASDRRIIKKLKLKFHGITDWPYFREYREGFLPWYISTEDARMMMTALEQLLDVAPRFKENPDLLYDQEDNDKILCRIPQKGEDGAITWEDNYLAIDEPEYEDIEVEITPEMIASVKDLPRREQRIETIMTPIPEPVQESAKDRPFFPWLILMAEANPPKMLPPQMLVPQASIRDMWLTVPEKFINSLEKLGYLPQKIVVVISENELFYDLLEPLCEALEIEIDEDEMDTISVLLQQMSEEGLNGFTFTDSN